MAHKPPIFPWFWGLALLTLSIGGCEGPVDALEEPAATVAAQAPSPAAAQGPSPAAAQNTSPAAAENTSPAAAENTSPAAAEGPSPAAASNAPSYLPATAYADGNADVQPQNILQSAIRTLERRPTLKAEIRHRVHLFDQNLYGLGSYLEQRYLGKQFSRMELVIQLTGQTSSLKQVCDGRFLWTYRKLGDEPKLTRVDVDRVAEHLAKAGATAGVGQSMLPGLGGLSQVLRGLNRSFDFTTAESGQLGREKRPVWRLVGRWRSQRLIEMLPDGEKAVRNGRPDLSKLPEHVPDRVVLMLGQADEFPYHIEYRRKGPEHDRALVTMEFSHVESPDLSEAEHEHAFTYNPGDLEYSDRTQSLLDSLGVGKKE